MKLTYEWETRYIDNMVTQHRVEFASDHTPEGIEDIAQYFRALLFALSFTQEQIDEVIPDVGRDYKIKYYDEEDIDVDNL